MIPRCTRQISLATCLAALGFIVSCGGGGGGGSDSGPAPAAAPSAAQNNAPSATNEQAISVESGPARTLNLVFTSVTVCAPGNASKCQTIDNVMVDTGSSGLRVISSVLSASLLLPQQTEAGGDPVAECAQFADGFSWGPLKLADLKIAGKQANSLPVQIIGDPAFPSIPSSCSSTGRSKNTVQSFGANGILGVSIFRQDCGAACAQSSSLGIYFACPASGCRRIAQPLAQQVQNPVAMFAGDNNGVLIDLPSVPPAGVARADGRLIFGIGTQANNALGSAVTLGVNPATGTFTTLYAGRTINTSFIDSGTNVLFFRDTSIPVCSGLPTAGFYCPASTLALSAVLQGTNGINASVNFSVANAQSLVTDNPTFTAFANLGFRHGSLQTFDWGLPFFYGRRVFVAIENASTPAGPGPYVAF